MNSENDNEFNGFNAPLEPQTIDVELSVEPINVLPLVAPQAEKTTQNKTALDVVSTKEQELLRSEEIGKAANLIGQEKIKSELASKAAEIKSKNADTAEKEFETETRSRRLKQLNAKLDLEHKYEMSIIKENGEHYAMLDKRKKLEGKYGYLYSKNEDKTLKDFSYSKFVNRIKSLTNSLRQLDKSFLQLLKYIVIGGLIVGGVLLLKYFKIL